MSHTLMRSAVPLAIFGLLAAGLLGLVRLGLDLEPMGMQPDGMQMLDHIIAVLSILGVLAALVAGCGLAGGLGTRPPQKDVADDPR